MKYVKRFIMREIFAIIYYEMLVGVENLAFYLQNKNCCIYNPNRRCCFRLPLTPPASFVRVTP